MFSSFSGLSEDKLTAVVPIKSTFLSKINWTQGIALLASVLVLFGVDLDPHTQAAIVTGIQAVTTCITWVLRTFFNKSVTPESV